MKQCEICSNKEDCKKYNWVTTMDKGYKLGKPINELMCDNFNTNKIIEIIYYELKEGINMNIFNYTGKEFDKKIDEIFKNKDKEKLKQELIECGLEVKVNGETEITIPLPKNLELQHNQRIQKINGKWYKVTYPEGSKIMEEDIKVLEDFVDVKLEKDKMEIDKGSYKLGPIYHNNLRLAIENLIKGYKDLEEELEWRIEQKVLDYRYVDNEMLRKDIIQRDYIPKSLVREKIEILDNIIDRLDTELAEAYIVREKLGTEEQIDNNEQYIYNMEQERSIRHTEKYAYLKLLQEGDDK